MDEVACKGKAGTLSIKKKMRVPNGGSPMICLAEYNDVCGMKDSTRR
jgi:hypothetical protein